MPAWLSVYRRMLCICRAYFQPQKDILWTDVECFEYWSPYDSIKYFLKRCENWANAKTRNDDVNPQCTTFRRLFDVLSFFTKRRGIRSMVIRRGSSFPLTKCRDIWRNVFGGSGFKKQNQAVQFFIVCFVGFWEQRHTRKKESDWVSSWWWLLW